MNGHWITVTSCPISSIRGVRNPSVETSEIHGNIGYTLHVSLLFLYAISFNQMKVVYLCIFLHCENAKQREASYESDTATQVDNDRQALNPSMFLSFRTEPMTWVNNSLHVLRYSVLSLSIECVIYFDQCRNTHTNMTSSHPSSPDISLYSISV
ncbi:hypothetical protein BDB01DRAFT_897287 [Pilobolus umbonatus]|nr:hypothetical protein BDB01DRAFT_897287 [Pilobolus umbonatus]